MDKTEKMFVSANERIREPRIRMGEEVVPMKQNGKHSGVLVDRGLNWVEHLREAKRRMSKERVDCDREKMASKCKY